MARKPAAPVIPSALLKQTRTYDAYLVELYEQATGRWLDVGVFSEAGPTLMPATGVRTRVLVHVQSRRSLERAYAKLRQLAGPVRMGWNFGAQARMRAALYRKRRAARHRGA